jgi:hypothetical protein
LVTSGSCLFTATVEASPRQATGNAPAFAVQSGFAPRASSHGSSSLDALACSALGAVVQDGSGFPGFFFSISSLDFSFCFSVMIFIPLNQNGSSRYRMTLPNGLNLMLHKTYGKRSSNAVRASTYKAVINVGCRQKEGPISEAFVHPDNDEAFSTSQD